MTPDRCVCVSQEMSATPAEIFAILADPRRHREIDGSGSIQDTVSGPGRLELGAKFGMKMRIGLPYQVTNTVVEFAENEVIAWQHMARHIWRYELVPTASGTRVTECWNWGVSPFALPMRLIGLPQKNEASIRATLQRLRAAVEGDVDTAPA